MTKVMILAASLFVSGGQALAREDSQETPAVSSNAFPRLVMTTEEAHFYDLFYSLPAARGHVGVDVGFITKELNAVASATVFPLMAKCGISENIEVGCRISLGVIDRGRSNFSSIMVGGKVLVGETGAVSGNILAPVGDANDFGLSVGYLKPMELMALTWNNHLQIGLLKGYAPAGVNVDALLVPTKDLMPNKVVGYLDIMVSSNTEDILGASLAFNLGPNVDILLDDRGTAVNVGVKFGVKGDSKADAVGFGVVLLKSL